MQVQAVTYCLESVRASLFRLVHICSRHVTQIDFCCGISGTEGGAVETPLRLDPSLHSVAVEPQVRVSVERVGDAFRAVRGVDQSPQASCLCPPLHLPPPVICNGGALQQASKRRKEK